MFKITSIGSDPELILLDKSTLNPVSAIGLNMRKDTINLYADNVLAEFNHSPFDPADFVDGIKETVQTVSHMLDTFKSGCTFQIGQCEAIYSDDDLSCKEAQAIGCEPFFNAYNPSIPSVPKPYTDSRRFAGGHIHIAYDTSKLPPELFVSILDKEFLSLDPTYGKTDRSNFYGARGSFRYKPYGIEYRASSNFWLAQPDLVTSVLADIQTFVNKKYYGA